MASSLKKAASSRLAIYFTNLFISFHYFIVIYINSAYLSKYVDTKYLSLLYIIGSLISLAAFSFFAKAAKLIGNYRLTLVFTFLELAALIGLGFGTSAATAIPAFILYLAVSPIIYLNLDVFLEKATTDMSTAGGIRGLFLTMQNITQVTCPLLIGVFLINNEYWRVYLLSSVFLFIAIIMAIGYLRKMNDARYHPSSLWQSLLYTLSHPILYHVMMAQYLLRFFYAWMVIYTPLYLYQHLGFSWAQISILFAIMLLPFLLLELPLGKIADSHLDEAEILIVGFILLICSTAVMPFITMPSIIPWMLILVISRIGASCVEIASESFFFRHVDASRADTISLFRSARPATYVIAAAIGAISLQFLSLRWSFLVLAAVLLLGFKYSFALRKFEKQKTI